MKNKRSAKEPASPIETSLTEVVIAGKSLYLQMPELQESQGYLPRDYSGLELREVFIANHSVHDAEHPEDGLESLIHSTEGFESIADFSKCMTMRAQIDMLSYIINGLERIIENEGRSLQQFQTDLMAQRHIKIQRLANLMPKNGFGCEHSLAFEIVNEE